MAGCCACPIWFMCGRQKGWLKVVEYGWVLCVSNMVHVRTPKGLVKER